MAELPALQALTPLTHPFRHVAWRERVDLALAGRVFVVRFSRREAGAALADAAPEAQVVAFDVPLDMLDARRWPIGLHAVLVTPNATLVAS